MKICSKSYRNKEVTYEEFIELFKFKIALKPSPDVGFTLSVERYLKFFKMDPIGDSLGFDLISAMKDKEFGIRDMLDEHPAEKAEIEEKLQYVKQLYNLLSDLGIIPGSTPMQDQYEAFNELILFILYVKKDVYKHKQISTQILDMNNDAVVLNIGGHNNIEQLNPSFSKNIGRNVKIINIDPLLSGIDHALVSQQNGHAICFFNAKFPSDYFIFNDQDLLDEHKRLSCDIDDMMLNGYLEALVNQKNKILDLKLYLCTVVQLI